MKNYELRRIDRHNYLVIVLSVDSVGVYLQSLRDDIRRLDSDVSGLYIDFLLRNGLSNRFFKISIKNHTLDDSTVTRCIVSKEVREVSDRFFSRNSQYLRKSIMPSYQKAKYIEIISKRL